ncbi:MAG TPA: hypothetical protein VFM83_00020 [Gaiellaceae bacterium]|nr:hypothetical protein [Gaiellaceae bacterium]
MIDRSLRSPVWLFSAGIALAYLASLSFIFVQETEPPGPLVLAVFALSMVAGLAIRRFAALALPVGAVACSVVWLGVVDEDVPPVALIGGLLLGVAVARTYEGVGGTGDAPARRWPLLKRMLRPIVTKETFEAIDDVLDRLRFRIDTLPNGLYQPVPGVPARAARGAGSESRWAAMLPVIKAHRVESAVDIGACEGYFSLMLGAVGIPTIAVENMPSNYRTALLAVRKTENRNVGVLALEVTPENVFTLPDADCVLCLSVWHHFVRAHGLGRATEMLETVWLHSGKVMLFDTGEDEMTPDFRLPEMTPDARSWLTTYLAETCTGSRVEHLGFHRAFDPAGEPCERNLFVVIRTD